MGYYLLVLCPVDPSIEIDLEATIEYLQKIEFIGAPCRLPFGKSERWLWSTGKRFTEFFRYADPSIPATTHDLFPQTVAVKGEACALEIKASPDCIFVSTSPLIKEPRCPTCGLIIEGEPVDVIGAWWNDGSLEKQIQFRWSCQRCKIAHKIWELDWSEVTGFHRYSIKVENYSHFGDTIDNTLWTVLREASGVDWHPTWMRI